jgi:heptaprenyl diphosphate synthase
MSLTLTSQPLDHRIAWLTALAISIHVLETALPSPVPGIKPGFANLVTIITLVMFGWSTAAWVTLLRVLAGSLILGTFLSPTFLLSLSGALSAVFILRLASWLPGRGFSVVGFSLLASMAHMAGQFLAAYTLFIPHPALFHLLPILMTAAVIFGLINAIIALKALQRLQQNV